MPKPLKSGVLRQRVTLWDVPEATTDSFGQPSQTATQIVNSAATDGGFWAGVKPLRGNEMLNVRQIWPTATHNVTMRWLGSAIPTSPDNPQGLIMPQMKIQLILDQSWIHFLFCDNEEKRNRKWLIIGEERIGATS
jgi:hypothetical protein